MALSQPWGFLRHRSGTDARRWGASLAVVAAVHAGALAAFLRTAAPDVPSPPQAVMAVELAAAVTAPPNARRDMTPGPQRDRAHPPDSAPQTRPEQERIPEKTMAKAAVPLPPAARPKPQRHKAPPPPIPAADPQPQDQRPAADAASAPPSMDAPPAPVAAAPAPGIATTPMATPKDAWRSALLAHIQRHLRYPGIAQARGQEGVVWVQFAMTCQGRVLSSSVQQSSEIAALDREALAVLDRAQPLPAPTDRSDDKIVLAIPVKFDLP